MSKINDKTKKIFKWSKANTLLTIGLILIMIPVTFFGVIIFQAYFESGKPINGDRIANERNVDIKQTDIDELDQSISNLSEVEDVVIILKVSTLRVYVDVKNDIAQSDYETLINAIYSKVNEVFPVDVYFSKADTMKQYDLEIHTYNVTEPSIEVDFIYYITNKNAAMLEQLTELVSQARNQELADELRGDNVASGNVDGEADQEAGE